MTTFSNIFPNKSTGKLIQHFIGQYESVTDLPDASNYEDGTTALVQGVGWKEVSSGSWVDVSVTQAQQLLDSLKTVDGAGSGLDADTLDGNQPGPGNGLDADTVDGEEATFLRDRANHTNTQAPGTISPQGTGSGLNADQVDGAHANATPGADLIPVANSDGELDYTSTSLPQVATLAALKALTAGRYNRVFLNSGGRSGAFVWDGSDLSTEVTNDPGEGVYVPPDSDTSGASGAWVRHYEGDRLYVTWFGAVGDDSTDNATAIQNADDAAAALAPGSSAILYFPAGEFVINSQISKNPYTTWQGVPGQYTGTADAEFGTGIRSTHDGNAVLVDAVSGPIYTYGGFRDISFVGPGSGSTAAVGLRYQNGVRQQFLERLYLRNFGDACIRINGGGEIYMDKVFITQSNYGMFMSGVADSWLSEVHAGSGLSWGGSIGYGIWMDGCNSIGITGSRCQVSTSVGIEIRDSERIRLLNTIVDQNDSRGCTIRDSHAIELLSCIIYDNGTSGTPAEGILIQATDTNRCEDVSVVGGIIYDRETYATGTGKASGSVVQQEGIKFSAISSGVIDSVSVVGVNMRDCPTPFTNVAQAGRLVRTNLQGSGDSTFKRVRGQVVVDGSTTGVKTGSVDISADVDADETLAADNIQTSFGVPSGSFVANVWIASVNDGAKTFDVKVNVTTALGAGTTLPVNYDVLME